MDYDENAKPSDFQAGQRVELHPACDLWMRGARFGEVRSSGRRFVTVEMDHPQVRRAIRVSPSNLRPLF